MQLSKKAMIVGVIDAFIALSLLRNFCGSSDYEGDYISNFEPMAGMRTVVRYPHHYGSPMLRTKSGLLEYEDTLADYRAVISDTLQRMPSYTRNRTEQSGITTMMFHINPNEVEQQPFYDDAASNLTASPHDSNYETSNNSEPFHWEDFLNNRDTPSVQSSPASTSSDKSENSGTLSDTTSAIVDNQESESVISEQHNIDLVEQMYKQDIDIGFHWQHLSPELQDQKTLNHNFNKDELENIDDYVIDGETGEQEFKSLPNLDLGGNLPGLLSKPDDFDIDEYLELLENSDLINLEQPLDELVRKEEPVLDIGENILPLGATADNNNLPPPIQVFQNQAAAAAPGWVENGNNGGYGNYEELNFFPTFTSNHQQQPSAATSHNNQQQQVVTSNSISQTPGMFDMMAKTNYPPQQQMQQPQMQQQQPQMQQQQPMQQQSQMMGQSNEIFVPISDQNYLLDVIEMQPPNNDGMYNSSNNAAQFSNQAPTYPQQHNGNGGMVGVQQNNYVPVPPQHNLNHNMHAAPSYPMETDQQNMSMSTSTESPGQIFFDVDKDVNMSNNMDVGTNDMFMDTCMFPPPPMDTNQVVKPRPPLPPVSTDTIESMPFLEELTSFDANVEVKPDPDMGTTQARETVVVVKEEVLDPKLIRDLKNFEHNHTYDGTNGIRKPIKKSDLSGSRKSRDEKKADDLNIPFSLEEMVFTPVDDFNEMLSRVTLSNSQQLLIKDIRRRGKNKIAAQNCRKRKVETINHMEEDVDLLRKRKEELIREQNLLTKQKLQIQKNYDLLRNKVLTSISSQAQSSSGGGNTGYDIFVMNDTMSGIVHPMSSSPGSSSSSSSSMRSLTESPPPGPFHHLKFPNHPHNQFHVKHEQNETTF